MLYYCTVTNKDSILHRGQEYYSAEQVFEVVKRESLVHKVSFDFSSKKTKT